MRESGLAVSPVCQAALADAVRNIGMARKAIQAIRNPDSRPSQLSRIAARLEARMTPRLSTALRLAHDAAGADATVDTNHLLIGLLDQADNFAVRLLETADVDTAALRQAAGALDDDPVGTPRTDLSTPNIVQISAEDGEIPLFSGLTHQARLAIASMLEASIDLTHNYLGCEHLLVGLLDQDDTAAGRVLRSFSVDASAVRRAVKPAGAGLGQSRDTPTSADHDTLAIILRRLEAIEHRLQSVGA